MTPDEIRATYRVSLEICRQAEDAEKSRNGVLALIAMMVGELAAQVAEFNQNFYKSQNDYGVN